MNRAPRWIPKEKSISSNCLEMLGPAKQRFLWRIDLDIWTFDEARGPNYVSDASLSRHIVLFWLSDDGADVHAKS